MNTMPLTGSKSKDPAVRSLYWKQYNRIHRIERAATSKKYRGKNKEMLAALHLKWREKNHVSLRLKWKEYALKNKAKRQAYNKLYHQRRYKSDGIYRQKLLATSKIRSVTHREYCREAVRKYAKKNPHVYKIKYLKYKALKRGATVDPAGIAVFIKSVKSKKTVICYYCKKRIPSFGCHIDHIVALSKGGNHASSNLCVSCPTCNDRKGAKNISSLDFIPQKLLSL